MKINLSKIKTKAIKAFELSPLSSKKRFINHDGTVAENKDTYLEFKRDVISSFGRS